MTDTPSDLCIPPSSPAPDTGLPAAAGPLKPEERAEALRAGSAPVPRNFFFWIIIGFALLGIGGLVADHYFGNTGQGGPTAAPTTIPSSAGPAAPSSPALAGTQVRTSTGAFLGLSSLRGRPAPAFTLHTPDGTAWSLARSDGRVVVLTFLNLECNDICPVLAAEITKADRILQGEGHHVQFVVINSDPLETSFSPTPPAAAALGLSHGSSIVLLSGPLGTLNTVWTNYGVTVDVQNATRLVSHNNVLYFIDPSGRLRYRSTPFANESTLGTYSLDPSEIARYARGIASTAGTLEKGST
jgi:protein SCO1/2